MKKESFRMEPSNLVCPRCSRGGYMYILHGSNVGELDIKCTNCETYFKSTEFYNTDPKRVTNYNRIIRKSPEELAEWIAGDVLNLTGGSLKMVTEAWADWLKQEATDGT